MGSFPHELPGDRHISVDAVRESFEEMWNVKLNKSRALASPTVPTPRSKVPSWVSSGRAKTFCSPIPTQHVVRRCQVECVVCPRSLSQRERANYAPSSCRLNFPGKGGTFTNASAASIAYQGDDAGTGLADGKSRPPRPKRWLDINYTHPSQTMDEIAALTPRSAAFPMPSSTKPARCNGPATRKCPWAHPSCTSHGVVRGRAVRHHRICRDRRAHRSRYPLLLTTGRILSNTMSARRPANRQYRLHEEDRPDTPPDAEQRGVLDGDWVRLASAPEKPRLRALITSGSRRRGLHHLPHRTRRPTSPPRISDWATTARNTRCYSRA